MGAPGPIGDMPHTRPETPLKGPPAICGSGCGCDVYPHLLELVAIRIHLPVIPS